VIGDDQAGDASDAGSVPDAERALRPETTGHRLPAVSSSAVPVGDDGETLGFSLGEEQLRANMTPDPLFSDGILGGTTCRTRDNCGASLGARRGCVDPADGAHSRGHADGCRAAPSTPLAVSPNSQMVSNAASWTSKRPSQDTSDETL